jgi:hypothetical protein
MNILYINHYAGSLKHGMTFRPYYLAREWIKMGHKVSIVGASFSHLRTSQPEVNSRFSSEIIDEIQYYWLKAPHYQQPGVKRIANMIAFVWNLFYYSKHIVKLTSPDAIVVTSGYHFDIYPGYFMAKRAKAKLICQLRDMWPLTPMIVGGYSKYHPYIWLMQKAENYSCRKCDHYVSLLGNSEDYLIKHGLKPGKFTHILNGFSEEDWSNQTEIPQEHKNLFKKLKNQNKTIVGYAGKHSPSNSLDVLLNTSAKIQNSKLAFVLVGSGPEKDNLIKTAENLNSENVYFLPPVNKSSIPLLLNEFDIAFIAGVKGELHKYGTAANKLTDYMLSGKPIIFAVDEFNSLVEKVKCGIQIPAENTRDLIKAIHFLSALSDMEKEEMGKRGKDFAKKELNYKALAKKFIEAVEKA